MCVDNFYIHIKYYKYFSNYSYNLVRNSHRQHLRARVFVIAQSSVVLRFVRTRASTTHQASTFSLFLLFLRIK